MSERILRLDNEEYEEVSVKDKTVMLIFNWLEGRWKIQPQCPSVVPEQVRPPHMPLSWIFKIIISNKHVFQASEKRILMC